VATFRSLQTGDDAADEHGRLLSDNVFGSQAQDALRRDFTINALYFDPSTEQVWDYVGGVADVKAKRLRLIGDPVTRYREDPVRMLRGARLAAKLGITIEKKTAAPIPELAPLLANVPPARLFDEMEKLLLSGHAVESLKSLRRHGLHHGVLPLLDVIVEQPLGQRFIELALANTDERIRDGKSATPAFLFATLLWHEVLATWNASKANGERPMPALFDAMDQAPGDPAPLRGDHQGDLGAAAALRAALGTAAVSPARASALSRRIRFPVAALRQRRDGRRARDARRLVGSLPARRYGRAREHAAARGRTEKAQAGTRAQAQARRCGR